MQIMLPDSTTAAQIAQITELLNMTALHDSDYNGVEFEISYGDYASVLDDDSDLGQKTLYAIQGVLQGQHEPGYTIGGSIYDRT